MRRVLLAWAILSRYVRVRLDLRKHRLPELVELYANLPPRARRIRVSTLRKGVDRILVLPGRPLRCLPRALVLYSMAVEQGHPARLMIGLPENRDGIGAHAWVEIDGIEVGPSPGRDGHEVLATYPINGPVGLRERREASEPESSHQSKS